MMIRKPTESDLKEILDIQIQAFGKEEGSDVASLVNSLVKDPTAMPVLSLMAVSDNQPTGHILFSKANVTGSKHKVSAVILAPLAVIPFSQRQGVGGRLIQEGLRLLSESAVELVFVLGHPEYYPRHGFEPAGVLGFEAPYPILEKHADAWMVKELVPGTISRINGRVACPVAMDKPEYWCE